MVVVLRDQLGGGYLFGLLVGFLADSIGAIVGAGIGRSFVISSLKDYPQFRSGEIAIRRFAFKEPRPKTSRKLLNATSKLSASMKTMNMIIPGHPIDPMAHIKWCNSAPRGVPS
ncbi:hypothetical protein JHK86_048291 [Glycine max]|nr:hypothetical protein JHK86_048291 [Glycine max]